MKMWKKSLFAVAAVAVMAGFVGCSDDGDVIDGGGEKPLVDTVYGMTVVHPEGWSKYVDEISGTISSVTIDGAAGENAKIKLVRDKIAGWPYAIAHGMLAEEGSLKKLGKVIVGYKINEGDVLIMGLHKDYSTDKGADFEYGYFGKKLSGYLEGEFVYDTIDVADFTWWSKEGEKAPDKDELDTYNAFTFRSADETGYNDADGSFGEVNTVEFEVKEILLIGEDGFKADLGVK